MKIITGQYGGRRFDPPRNLNARPTTDLAKQALFNILQNRIDLEGCRALDLFSGTGSISFELLSRGAAHVVSVEQSRPQQQFIQKVAEQLKVPRNRHQLIRGDVFRYLNASPALSIGSNASSAAPFDLIFADPPYDCEHYETLVQLIFDNNLLREGGMFVLEHDKYQKFEEHPHFMEQRHYGKVNFTFFAQTIEEDEDQ